MRFLGWFASEGYLLSAPYLKNCVGIAQTRDLHKPEIRQVLREMGVSFRECEKGFEFNHGPLAAWLRSACYDGSGHRAWNKCVPRSVMDYPSHLLAEMFGSMMRGDGHFEKNGFRRYITTSKLLADDTTEVLQKMGTQGWYATIRLASGGIVNGREVKARRLQYRVAARTGNGSAIPVPVKVAYGGLIHKVTAGGATLHVRRHGRTAWCG